MESELDKQKQESFHIIHKIPSGDGPYARAKHAQVIEKDREAAIEWYWKAINEGDRVESALKDMALTMMQLSRTQEAIEAINSFRHLCPIKSQQSLDNLLIDLYKKCGKVDEQIVLFKRKLRFIFSGQAFNGKLTKKARCSGNKFQISFTQETSRLLGNLGWAYMKKSNYMAAEMVYRKAQTMDADANKALNLCHCLIQQGKYDEAHLVLQDVLDCKLPGCDEFSTLNRARDLAQQLDARHFTNTPLLLNLLSLCWDDNDSFDNDEKTMDGGLKEWPAARSRRLPVFKEMSQFRDQLSC